MTWLWIFYLILPIGVIAIVAALRVLLDLRLYRRPTFSCLDRDALPRPRLCSGSMILLPLYWQGVRQRAWSTPDC